MKGVTFTTAVNIVILLIGFISFDLPKNIAQTSTEAPQISEDQPPVQPSGEITNPEKEQPEAPMDEEERMKREEELNKYCESAPDDPECD